MNLLKLLLLLLLEPVAPKQGSLLPQVQGLPIFPLTAPLGHQGLPIRPTAATGGDQGLPITASQATRGDQGLPITASEATQGHQGLPIRPTEASPRDQGLPISPRGTTPEDQGLPINLPEATRRDQGLPISHSKASQGDQGLPISPTEASPGNQGLPIKPWGSLLEAHLTLKRNIIRQVTGGLPVAECCLLLVAPIPMSFAIEPICLFEVWPAIILKILSLALSFTIASRLISIAMSLSMLSICLSIVSSLPLILQLNYLAMSHVIESLGIDSIVDLCRDLVPGRLLPGPRIILLSMVSLRCGGVPLDTLITRLSISDAIIKSHRRDLRGS